MKGEKEKKIIILQHGGGELANQLWNFISIYAYCLEKKYECKNYSFFEYGKYFNIPVGNKLIDILFFSPFKSYAKRRSGIRVQICRFLYKLLYEKPITILFREKIISSKNTTGNVYYLPPTKKLKTEDRCKESCSKLYTVGWLFRNPKGIVKHRDSIVNYFSPNEKILDGVNTTINSLRATYDHVVGVHIRQADYASHKGGKYFVDQNRIHQILKEYLSKFNKDIKTTQFLITTDGTIDEKIFNDLNYKINKKSAVEDLFTLAECDLILGSDSSFGNFAAYYRNIPHIIFKKENMDWEYYKNKNTYFENKYCTTVHF